MVWLHAGSRHVARVACQEQDTCRSSGLVWGSACATAPGIKGCWRKQEDDNSPNSDENNPVEPSDCTCCSSFVGWKQFVSPLLM